MWLVPISQGEDMLSAAALDLSGPELSLRLQQQELVAEFGRFAMETDSLQPILDQASVVVQPPSSGPSKMLVQHCSWRRR